MFDLCLEAWLALTLAALAFQPSERERIEFGFALALANDKIVGHEQMIPANGLLFGVRLAICARAHGLLSVRSWVIAKPSAAAPLAEPGGGLLISLPKITQINFRACGPLAH